MERICNELDEAKAEVDKLKSECRSKAELYENLKRAYNEQLSKFQEARLKTEKQTQELAEKAGETLEAKQMCEELKSSLREKEAVIKRLSAGNDKLRNDSDNKFRTWDVEKRGLEVALEEATTHNADQEQKISALKREVEGLKELLSDSKKKYLEVEKKAEAARELRERDDMLFNLEEVNRKIEDQLKWKKEQFNHLEEAHEKLQGQFKESKKEWKAEKGTLLDEIYSLQTRLDSQFRISEDLQKKLQMCNQALAHEESRRKLLEIQVSEFQTRYENVAAQYDAAQSQVGYLTSQRDNEIASLRNSLSRKDSLYKEMEYQTGKLELENQELLVSIKKLQEAGIQKAGSSSSTAKFRNKLRSLEQVNKEVAMALEAKETECKSQLEELTAVVSQYKSDSENKSIVIEKLKVELETCYFSMMELRLQNEENTVMLLVLRSGISEAKQELENNDAKMTKCNNESEDVIADLRTQLDLKNAALVKLERNLAEECEKTESLLRKLDTISLIEEQRSLSLKEVDRYKELLEESTKHELYLKEKMLDTQIESEKKVRKIGDALNRANTELAEAVCEANETMFELWTWKTIAEQLKDELEETHDMRKDLEASLLEQVEVGETIKQEKYFLLNSLADKDRTIFNLQQQVGLLEHELKENEADESDALVDNLKNEKRVLLEDVMNLSREKEKLVRIITEMDERLENISSQDMQLMERLIRITESLDCESSESVRKQDDQLAESVKENGKIRPSETKRFGSFAEERPPFRELKLQ